MCGAQCVLVLALLVGLVQAWDIAVTAGDRIEFYTDDGTKTDTVRLNSQNLTALAYDEVHDMLLYVDKQSGNDSICGYSMTSLDSKCYVQRNGRNIQGLAFDPVTEVLYFTDTKEKSINWFSFKPKPKNNVFGNLLIKMYIEIPTDIAVDSCRGYIYWIKFNTNQLESTIERARLDGSEREVIFTAEYKQDLHSLAIDQEARKIYWFMATNSNENVWHIYSADFNGRKFNLFAYYTDEPDESITAMDEPDEIITAINHPNSLTIKQSLFIMHWRKSEGRVIIYQMNITTKDFNVIFRVQSENVGGIAANYKYKEHVQAILGCDHVMSMYETNDSFKNPRQYEGPSCIHGVKDIGQALCKCAPGYIGERCDVSICENYCLQGNCSFTQERLPECRCNAGYSGSRCEVNLCYGYCLNNGICSINISEPVCQCKANYLGNRCEVSLCENYCLQGNCSFNREGLPQCSCNAGFSGERCEVNVCNGYCFYNGTCSLNEEDEPVCECVREYEGEKCEVPVRLNNSDGFTDEEVLPACQCDNSHGDSRFKDDQNKTISSTSRYYSAERNLTLADLLANWQKPVATISVLVEVKTNK